jgi:hypothetical protein
MHLLWSYKSRFTLPRVLTATLAGFNPLHGAVASGDDVAVRRLLEAGADLNIPAIVDEDNPFSKPKDSIKTGEVGCYNLCPKRVRLQGRTPRVCY